MFCPLFALPLHKIIFFVMKKYILILLLAMTATATVSAADKYERVPWDIFVIPKAGAAGSFMRHSGGEFKIGLTGGVAMQVYFTPKLAFDVELAYLHAGTKNAYITWVTTENDGP